MESVFQILVESWEQRAKEAAASPSEGGCEEELSLSYGCVAKLVCLPLPWYSHICFLLTCGGNQLSPCTSKHNPSVRFTLFPGRVSFGVFVS